MFQLMTQYGGYGLYAQIALGLFFIAFVMILFSTLTRPKSQMKHYARMALTDDIAQAPAPGDSSEVGPEISPGSVSQVNEEHGATRHE